MISKIKRRVLVTLGWNSPRLFRGIGHYAREAGWHLETRQFYLETVPDAWDGEGLIVSHSPRPDLIAFMRAQASQQPTVLLGGERAGIDAPQVTEDNRAAGSLAARHLVEYGHRHFAWFSPQAGQVATDRREGFRAVLADTGFDCHMIEPPQDAPAEKWLVKKLRTLPRPLALLTLDDQVASETIEACLAQGWRVPEEIAVIGVGNIEIACECSHVPISSVDLDEEGIGRRAAILLDKLMRRGKASKEPIVVPPRRVIVRQSTDFLAMTDQGMAKAMEYVTANLHRPLSIDQIAAVAGVSRRTLYLRFQHYLRSSPADFLLRMRLERARRLLSISDEKISAVANRCGLGSLRTLTRVMLKYEGVTPHEWRKLQHSSL